MRSIKPHLPGAPELFRLALSQWDSEGGAGPCGPQEGSHTVHPESDPHPVNVDEIIQLRIRVIALENLMIAVLAQGTEHQRSLARTMAELISPRNGSTPHPLTTKASSRMDDLIERSERIRNREQI